MTKKRLFICDPVCAQALGHNVPALSYFAKAFSPSFDEVVALCAKALPERVAKTNGFVRFFSFYYSDFIKLDTGYSARAAIPSSRFLDSLEGVATDDAARLLTSFDLTDADSLFYPSTDYYGLVGLLNAMSELPARKRPKLFLRFIGVMENASKVYRSPMTELIARLRGAGDAGLDMSLSCETPRWADQLAELLDKPVCVVPYPEVGELLPLPPAGLFEVYCPGSARHDKGFMDLGEIFRTVRREDPDLRIRFTTQILPYAQCETHETYIAQLGAIPGVRLLDPAITSAEMLENYIGCSATLLPYERDIYKYRGSAVMMEAAFLGRPIITLSGTGFADQVRYYGLGTVVDEIWQLPAAVRAMAAVPRKSLAVKARQARDRFHVDMRSAYSNWLAI